MRRYPFKPIAKWAARGLTVAALAALCAGCVRNPGDTQNLQNRFDTAKIRSQDESNARLAMQRQIIPIRVIHNSHYVALRDIARATGYHAAWLSDGHTYAMGDHDAVWSFRVGQSLVNKAGTEMRMPAPAVVDQGLIYIPVSAVHPLFAGDTVLSPASAGYLSVAPRTVIHETGADGTRLNFSGGPRSRAASNSARKTPSPVAFAAKLLGTKYEFGAGVYPASGTFDSSSFTRYVMKNAGVELPRTAREQSKVGRAVSRDRLREGDLLFFYIPGRYKSQAAVGHVGMYMGEGKMIHASPEPQDGVQISLLNQPAWKRQFLYAKRVLP